jgi:hypothetical protein
VIDERLMNASEEPGNAMLVVASDEQEEFWRSEGLRSWCFYRYPH